ncbi:RNA degradosome polyphosphate kinase [Halalkalibacter urbisdiaboli]|uniref:RNA degradosome polyphosphate kinase n=1 Tax=Halalkalibacter urbisdiaboli TaxID=1960589 RepID=UPI000B4365CD|nr:RNA degradosome polyphosphate kinase [Halalkalibacter urbisdiaboli]
MEITYPNNNLDLDNPSFYNNRELSWLDFNHRVLQEATDVRNALLERFKFLAIFSSNLDEFFMVRVAGLQDQVKVGFNRPENKAGLTPKEQLSAISNIAHNLVEEQDHVFLEELVPQLANEQIKFVSLADLTPYKMSFLEEIFDEQIFAVLTPMAIDAYRPFPMLLNKSLNLAVILEEKNTTNPKFLPSNGKLVFVQVPSMLNRFIELPSEGKSRIFVLLEDVITQFIYKLFKGYQVKSVTPFRITRNADLTIHEEGAEDLLQEIEEEIKKRKWGSCVRLEVQHHCYDEQVVKYLIDELEIDCENVYSVKAPLDLTFLFSFYKTIQTTHEHLVTPSFIPQPSLDLEGEQDIFEKISKQDVLLHHPYESFEPVIQFISQAADDPDVLAIKQTLYRVSGESPIIKSLERAAEKGKQVTVLVELKARFDEENNVQWARELEKAGCHVIYGMTYLKTHSKITLVVRRKKGKIERFVHLGTGNYNDATARLYTDMGLLTSNQKIGIDATNFFNYLSGYMEKPEYHHLAVSPYGIRNTFIELIKAEIRFHKKYGNGRIIAQMNSLTDKRLIIELYEASNAGVKIDLIVRGICCLRPGIKGVSENITVRSIVGTFLEHPRIYCFHHNGLDKVFLSSADMMTRNMDKRVEILFPILKKHLKQRIHESLTLMLNDNCKAREQDCHGVYHYVKRAADEEKVNSQLIMCQKAYDRKIKDKEHMPALKLKHKLAKIGNSYLVKIREIYGSIS